MPVHQHPLSRHLQAKLASGIGAGSIAVSARNWWWSVDTPIRAAVARSSMCSGLAKLARSHAIAACGAVAEVARRCDGAEAFALPACGGSRSRRSRAGSDGPRNGMSSGVSRRPISREQASSRPTVVSPTRDPAGLDRTVRSSGRSSRLRTSRTVGMSRRKKHRQQRDLF